MSSSCSARVQRFAEVLAAGATKPAAARAAGLSSKGGSPWRVLERPEVAELVALLRERGRLDSRVTLAGQVARIQRLGREAEAAGDHSAALRAEDMVNKLMNLYPDTRLQLSVSHDVDFRGVTPEELAELARLRHEVRPQLAARAAVLDVTAVEVTPEERPKESPKENLEKRDEAEEEEDLSDVL